VYECFPVALMSWVYELVFSIDNAALRAEPMVVTLLYIPMAILLLENECVNLKYKRSFMKRQLR